MQENKYNPNALHISDDFMRGSGDLISQVSKKVSVEGYGKL